MVTPLCRTACRRHCSVFASAPSRTRVRTGMANRTIRSVLRSLGMGRRQVGRVPCLLGAHHIWAVTSWREQPLWSPLARVWAKGPVLQQRLVGLRRCAQCGLGPVLTGCSGRGWGPAEQWQGLGASQAARVRARGWSEGAWQPRTPANARSSTAPAPRPLLAARAAAAVLCAGVMPSTVGAPAKSGVNPATSGLDRFGVACSGQCALPGAAAACTCKPTGGAGTEPTRHAVPWEFAGCWGGPTSRCSNP